MTTFHVDRVGIAEAADLKGITRQAIWLAVQEGRVNSVQGQEGAWLVYLDEKWDGWKASMKKGRRGVYKDVHRG